MRSRVIFSCGADMVVDGGATEAASLLHS